MKSARVLTQPDPVAKTPEIEDADRAPRRRLRGEARRAAIIDAAVAAFADQGFGVSTRDLAGRMGVTQALLYRYFPSKDAIVEAVIERFARRRWPADFAVDLVDGDGPLEDRMTAFFLVYIDNVPSDGLRLFVRAALDGIEIGTRFGPAQTEDVLRPVVVAMRRALGLAGLDERPMLRGEREIAMTIHSSIAWLLYRRFIFKTAIPDSPVDLVRLRVRTALPGALAELRAMHGDDAPAGLKVEQLRPILG